MSEERELLLSVTRKDFRFDTFRAGGKGGQKQNKTSSGVRCVHPPSGAVGEARDSRSQPQNRKHAWLRCVESHEFQRWLRVRIAEANGRYAAIDRQVEESMRPENLLVELFIDGEWQPV